MRSPNVNSCWVFPIIFLFPIMIYILMKGLLNTDEHLKLVGNFSNCMIMMFRQFAEFGFIATIHFWVGTLLIRRFKLPSIVCNLPFFNFYVVILIINFLNFEMGKNSMHFETPSWVLIYFLKLVLILDHFSKPLYSVPRLVIKISSRPFFLKEMMEIDPGFMIFELVLFFSVMIGSLTCILLYRYDIINSTFSYKYYKNYLPTNEELSQSTKQQFVQKKSISINKFFFFSNHLLGFIYLILNMQKCFSNSMFKLSWFSYFTVLEGNFLSASGYERSIEPKLLEQLTNNSRNYLPPGRRWLDQRDDPVYPAVHADLETFCAYNNYHTDCKDFKKVERTPLVDEIPNVLLIIYESFTPNTELISEEFLKEHTHTSSNDSRRLLTNTKYFHPERMKNLDKLQDYAINFSGMSSFGAPTSLGWHGLITGMIPSQSHMNTLDGSLLHSDDFPSQMRDSGFRTLHISSGNLHADCANIIVWRKNAEEEAANRLKCKEAFGDLNDDEFQKALLGERIPKLKECDPKEIKKYAEKLKKRGLDLPKMYDFVDGYYLRPEVLKYYIMEDKIMKENSYHLCDRFLGSMLLTHWKQQKELLKRKGIKKPIFGSVISAESHIEFFGYDLDQFYEDKITEEDKKDVDVYARKRFRRVNKYADKYLIGAIIDWFKENEPNTIFIVTGDHGSRKMPNYQPDQSVIDDIVYSSNCAHTSTGPDSFFVPSGMIGYLGDDPKVKEVLNLDKLKGKTVKIPTDHNDLVYTIEEIINKLNGTSMQPTHRRSRNLIDLATNLSNSIEEGTQNEYLDEINKSNWKSISHVTYSADFREGVSLLRTHPGDPKGSHFYKQASYPNCVKKNTDKPFKVGTSEGLEAYDRMFSYLGTESYLLHHNRLYNFAFRDKECVKKGYCEFPQPIERFYSYQYYYLLFVLGIYICLNFLFFFLLEVIALLYFRTKKGNHIKLVNITSERKIEVITSEDSNSNKIS